MSGSITIHRVFQTNLSSSALLACSLAAAIALATPSGAADLPSPPPTTNTPDLRVERSWEFVIAPYLLAPTIQGDTTIGRLPNTSLDVSPGTIFENLQFGAMGHFEALYNGRFGATLDVAYMDLGSGRTFPRVGGTVSAGVKQLVSEAFFGYRFWRQGSSWLEAYAGGRWWYNQIDVTANVPRNSFSRTITEQWIDPVIGLRGQHFLNDKWSLSGSANVGGFGLVSDFTWGAQAGVGYHFNERWAMHLHYKATGVDYDNGKSGTEAFSYNTVTHGPMAGVAFRF
jgi:opacity protein-like surface antigen